MDTLEIVKRNRVAIENNKYMLKELANLIKDYPNDKQFQNSILTKARNINNDIKTMEAENNRIFAAIELIPGKKIKKYFHMLYVDDMTRKEAQSQILWDKGFLT